MGAADEGRKQRTVRSANCPYVQQMLSRHASLLIVIKVYVRHDTVRYDMELWKYEIG